jgi:hypothetical protein
VVERKVPGHFVGAAYTTCMSDGVCTGNKVPGHFVGTVYTTCMLVTVTGHGQVSRSLYWEQGHWSFHGYCLQFIIGCHGVGHGHGIFILATHPVLVGLFTLGSKTSV